MPASSSSVDLTLMISLLYALVILSVMLVLLTALFRVPKEHSSSLRDVFRQSRFLELTTVLVIIISGTYLSIEGKLSEGAVSLLSGIAGYVLGGLASPRPQQEPTGSVAQASAGSRAQPPAGSTATATGGAAVPPSGRPTGTP
jgi:hypothetical protein